MTDLEIQILKTVQELGSAEPVSIAQQTGVSEEWVFEICMNMITDRYLDVSSDGTFELTEKSAREISSSRPKSNVPILEDGI